MKQTFRIAVIVALAGGLLLSRGLLAQGSRTAEVQFKAAQHKEQVEGDLQGALEQYKKIAQGSDRRLAANALLRMGECYEKLGDTEARKIYERVVREFSDQAETASRCESIAFNPWHALPAHRPLGNMNRARKEIYRAMAAFRGRRAGAAAGAHGATSR